MDESPRISIVIPVYNEAEAVRAVAQEIQDIMAAHEISYELILVDDGSTDDSLQYMKEVPEALLVQHDFNQGYGAALKSGIREASGEWICITDADGSYPNNRIPDLFSKAEGAHMVVGARTAPDVKYPFIRAIPKTFLIRYASWISGYRIPDINSGLRLFRKTTYRKFETILPDSFSFTTTITVAMLVNRLRVHFEEITYHKRIGQSKIKPVRDTVRFFLLIFRLGVYFAPLRVFSPLIGMMFMIFLASLAYDIRLENLTDKTVLLLTSCVNFLFFTLLADMIHKTRTPGRFDDGG